MTIETTSKPSIKSTRETQHCCKKHAVSISSAEYKCQTKPKSRENSVKKLVNKKVASTSKLVNKPFCMLQQVMSPYQTFDRLNSESYFQSLITANDPINITNSKRTKRNLRKPRQVSITREQISSYPVEIVQSESCSLSELIGHMIISQNESGFSLQQSRKNKDLPEPCSPPQM